VNPFDLRGPDFLVFYLFLSILVIGAVFLLRHSGEKDGTGRPPIDDPYLVAFLRGGVGEAVRVTALSLVDRGLLAIKPSGTSPLFSGGESHLELNDPRAIDSVKRPIEKCVLEAFKTSKPIGPTLESLEAYPACTDYERKLEGFGMIADSGTRAGHRLRQRIAIGLLLGLAILKVLIALTRGRTNILFLIILACLGAFVVSRIGNPFRTARGEKFLEDVKTLFASIRLRAASLRPGGASSDLVWLASAFGLTAVPALVFPHVVAFMSRNPLGASGSRDSDSGGFSSGCGSSSCGGGGGCGGGGCGGCGS
jgi:uncharacterized protein (TIGR04222 family)